MDNRPGMEMIRIPQPERVYEREAIFGRDASSVFPTETAKQRSAQMEELKKAVGLDSSKFITETQLEEIRKTRGATVEDGAVVRDKSLAAILAENKAKKDEAFQDVWKTMKQGKNRPLDEDDLSFVNSLVDAEAARDRSVRDAERQDLDAFQEAVRRAAEQRTASSAAPPPPAAGPAEPARPPRPPAPRPLVRVRQKRGAAGASGVTSSNNGGGGGEAIKRQRPAEQEEAPPDAGDPAALAGLIGGYASDSEGESGE